MILLHTSSLVPQHILSSYFRNECISEHFLRNTYMIVHYFHEVIRCYSNIRCISSLHACMHHDQLPLNLAWKGGNG